MSIRNFYATATPDIAFYGSGTSGTEPDMRQELINMFDGKYPEIAKAQTGLLRRMRTDSNNRKIACGCVDSITREPDKDRFCPICYGEGFLWDEELLQYYRVLQSGNTNNALKDKLIEPGLINIPIVVFYIRYDSAIVKEDKVVRIAMDLDGVALTPRYRIAIYRVESVWDYRSDNGKLEYWKVYTHLEDVKYLNPPSYGEV